MSSYEAFLEIPRIRCFAPLSAKLEHREAQAFESQEVTTRTPITSKAKPNQTAQLGNGNNVATCW